MTDLTVMPQVLTVEEAAHLLRIGRSAAYQAVRAGEIPHIKVGRCIRVPRHRLEHLLGLGAEEISSQNESNPAAKPGSTQSTDDGGQDEGYPTAR